MILLQIVPKEIPSTKEGVLWIVISVLIGGIVWLALWVRKMHNETVKYLKENSDRQENDKRQMVGVVEKNTEAFFQMKGAIDANTMVTKGAAESGERSAERLDNTMRNLNENILKNGNKRE
jgi:hypothetical protein